MKLPEIEITHANIWQSPNDVKTSKPRFVTRYEIECYISGGGKSRVDGEECDIVPGLILFARPGQIRQSRFPFKTYFIYFDIFEDNGISRHIRNIPTYTERNQKSTDLVKSITETFETNKMLSAAYLLELINILAVGSHQKSLSGACHGQKEIYSAIEFMKSNITKKLTVSDMSAKAGYSAPHFSALFRSLTNSSPYDYFMGLKVSEAKRLLISRGYSVSQTAIHLGFNSTSHFCDTFRKYTEKTPGEFIKSGISSFYEID